MDNFDDRLTLLIHLSELSNNEFAKSINESKSQISKYLNNQGKPAYDTLISILTKFPDLNARWLLTGEAPMFLSPPNVLASGENTRKINLNRIVEMFDTLFTYHAELEKKLQECEIVYNDFKKELLGST